MSADCRSQRIALYRIRHRDALGGQPATFRLAVGSLPSDGVLDSWPWIKSDDRPIASKGKNSAFTLNTVPGEPATRTVRSRIARPDIQSVIIGIGVQRLEAGNHFQLAETRNVLGSEGFNVLDSVLYIFH